MNPDQKKAPSIDAILTQRRVIITCGIGGVGKTTLSAALGIRAAILGKRAVVITIDPAKRLANSLGLKTLIDEPTDLSASLQKVMNTPLLGTFSAVIPDTRRTFEKFARELAPSEALVERILKNPIFDTFARDYSGTNEYMALERLLWLYKQEAYDTIILDTPPSRHTLTFLNAPRLLSQFFDEKVVRWLLLPTNKLMAMGVKKTLSILERLTGAGFMTNLLDFVSALFEVQTKFTQNLTKVSTLLASDDVGFIVVTAPSPEKIPEIDHFVEALQRSHFHFDGVALNRTLGGLKVQNAAASQSKSLHLIKCLQAREEKMIENLLRNPIPICAKLPELARDVHSVEDLLHVAQAFSHPVSDLSTATHATE